MKLLYILNIIDIALAVPILVPRSFSSLTLSSTGLYDELLKYVEYCGAAYCIDSTAGVQVGYLNSSCTGEACVTADDDVYVVNVVESLANAIILRDSETEKIVIAFQGSSSLIDWLIDFTFIPVYYKPYAVSHDINTKSFSVLIPTVHLGFETATNNFLDNAVDVLKALESLYPNYEVVVTGHSLGGALASLTGVELYLMGYNPAVISYASPRVFGLTLKDWVDDVFNTDDYLSDLKSSSISSINANTFTRITHIDDIVPCVPLYVMGYSHPGAEFYITESDLPQPIGDVIVRGEFELKNELETLGDLVESVLSDPGNYLKSGALSSAHLDYFIEVSEC